MVRTGERYDTYFRLESHDQRELSKALIDFLHRLDFVEIDDYVVDKDERSVEVHYACTVAQARMLGFTAGQIRELRGEE
jgi:hypothetical protein